MAETEKPVQKLPILFGGSCACGRITYECTGMNSSGSFCHCVTCLKLSGGPYQAFRDVQSKDVTFYDNKEALRYEGLPKDSIGGITFLRFSKAGERAFCVDCYSPLAMRYMHEYDTVAVTLGTVDEKTVKDEKVKEALRPQTHIFASQAAWWDHSLKDGIPVRERFGNDYEERMIAWEQKHG